MTIVLPLAVVRFVSYCHELLSVEGKILSKARRLDVLRAVVSDYVNTREPVGSRQLVERHQLGVSPATVRNDMAALEEEGLIRQPHTSAGRVPTDRGYRIFVDKIEQIKPLSVPERRAITRFFEDSVGLEDVLERAVRLLAQLTGQTAVVELPALPQSTFRHLEVVSLAPRRALIILISDSGRVDQGVCELTFAIDRSDLDVLGKSLSGVVVGKTLEELREVLPLWDQSITDSELRSAAVSMAQVVLNTLSASDAETRIVMSGMANLSRFDEDFVNTLTPVVQALEEQVVLLKLFSEMAMDQQQISVVIGEEIGHSALSETAIVSSSFDTSGSTSAHLGVIGPTRMDYPASMAAVRAVARYLSRFLNQ